MLQPGTPDMRTTNASQAVSELQPPQTW